MKNSLYLIIYILVLCMASTNVHAQYLKRDTAVTIDYSRTPRQLVVKNITVTGIPNFDPNMLVRLSGITVGETISIPGDEITQAIKRYWKNGLFSDVAIGVDSIINDSAYLYIKLAPRPRISKINYNGVKKSEKDDLKDKLGLVQDNQLTPNMIDRAKILGKRYFEDKGFKNAEIEIIQQDDPSAPDKVIVDVNVKKNGKILIRNINVHGNTVISEKKLKGNIFSPGVLKTIREQKGFNNWFRGNKKFVDSKYKEAKENLQNYYAELGYRDAIIVADTVKAVDEKHVDINIYVEEGEKYYIRNIEWVGNTVYSTDHLAAVLNMNKGDVYNQKLLSDRIMADDDAVGNLYYNNGYVFYSLDPVEVNIVGDSIDLEMRINEGPQARISRVKITGNDRVYENVVRRELRNKPGDLFSKQALERSFREIGSMGHFNPENIKYDIQPDINNGTVDLGWGLESKSNDQIEFSLGYGQTGVIGKIGLKFANFSMANLFKKGGLRRGVMPQGNGETLSISGQTNGSYYQMYNISYVNPWFGGKRPNTFSFNAFYSKQTDVSDRYYNSAYYGNYYNNMYGYGYGYGGYGYGYGGNYENFYDPDKYQQIFGVSIGWGKRLRWPDDYFNLSADLSYTRYMMKDWNYFSLMTNGNCNNLTLRFMLTRHSIDNQIFPRSGSEIQLSVAVTPPFSLWDGKDYANLANNPSSSTYMKELQDKYTWIEYHKWKFKARTFTALSGHNKCFVLMTRAEIGLLGSYNKHKPSPFENYYMGGDGTSGYSSLYSTETIGLRGYDNGSITPNNMGYAYTRFSVELRYPFMLGASTNIFGLIFVEGGNCWSDISGLNPFDLKKSVGVGARIFLPMVGLLGVDWAYGFDKVNGSSTPGGSHFHFVLGQEF